MSLNPALISFLLFTIWIKACLNALTTDININENVNPAEPEHTSDVAQTWNLIKKYRLANTYLGERNHNRNFIIHDGSNQTSNHCFLYRYRHSQSNLLLHWNDRLLLEDKQAFFLKNFSTYLVCVLIPHQAFRSGQRD